MTSTEQTESPRITMAEYVARHRITVTRVTDKGLQRKDGWEHYAYTVQLTNGRTMGRITVPWKQGTGITTDPRRTPEAILDSVVLDATAGRNAAAEMKLVKFLGGEAELENLIENVESL